MERIQKIIAQSGYCSRRKAEELIKKGLVSVNGKVITEMGYKASFNDYIEVEGNSEQAQDLRLALEYFKWSIQQERKRDNGN